jgi:hypothetical protein
MSLPRRIPVRGDIPPAAVAELLGLSVSDFNAKLDQLHERGFPIADPTTGFYCAEAVDRWRLRRHPHLFPELTTAPVAAAAARCCSRNERGRRSEKPPRGSEARND